MFRCVALSSKGTKIITFGTIRSLSGRDYGIDGYIINYILNEMGRTEHIIVGINTEMYAQPIFYTLPNY